MFRFVPSQFETFSSSVCVESLDPGGVWRHLSALTLAPLNPRESDSRSFPPPNGHWDCFGHSRVVDVR